MTQQTRDSNREQVIVDVTTPLLSLTYPVVRLLLITALCWMAIGYFDRPSNPLSADAGARNLLVFLWLFLVVVGFILPIVKLRRRRIVLTSKRLIVRSPGVRDKSKSLPLNAIRHVNRRGRNIEIIFLGVGENLVIQGVPKARRICALINEQVELQQQSTSYYDHV